MSEDWELKNYLPDDPDEIVELEPQEAAECVLAFLADKPEVGVARLDGFSFGAHYSQKGFPPDRRDEITQVLAEGWAWLVRECLLIPDLKSPIDWFILSRRGRALAESGDFEQFRAERSLARDSLHPKIAKRAFPDFIRGDYEGAIFKALREVEIAVRKAGSFPDGTVGVPLMREAFEKDRGPLRDKSLEEAERLAMAHLFAGAIGLYKNPSSHRIVDLDAAAAAEIVQLASHLMRIIDARVKEIE